MALSYKGNASDPVGFWYEAALPSRNAFCMRDVSHQIIGAEIIGLGKENKNMLKHFARNISGKKDWCSYWEINKFNLPAPEDYRNDSEFWYNLNANFDIIFACWRLYQWTGDKTYIEDPVFTRFFEKSVTDYIDRWALQDDSLLTRPTYLNTPAPFNSNDYFHRCRGLASYTEDVPGLKMGVDLVAAIYRGLLSYSHILRQNGNVSAAENYKKKAEKYRTKIEQDWWDNQKLQYHTYYSDKGEFGKGGGSIFLLWFEALKDSLRKKKTIEHLISDKENVENTSYLPLLLYRQGYRDKAYEYISYLSDPATPRREYPEVSYAVIEAIVKGLMGIEADAAKQRITTLFRGADETQGEIDNLCVLHTTISVKHSSKQTIFFNKGAEDVYWRPSFEGKKKEIMVNNKVRKASFMWDENGYLFSFVDVLVKRGQKIKANCK